MSQNRSLLLGLDFGSTTSSALIISATISAHAVTGANTFNSTKTFYRSKPVFTPFNNHLIDEVKISNLLDFWLAESNVDMNSLFATSAIITGLAAQRANVESIRKLIIERFSNVSVVAADDPHLESWLAFKGNCTELSKHLKTKPVLNLDIGGGTTNSAVGVAGNVVASGCHFVGARHFQFNPGSYQLTAISNYGIALLEHLNIRKSIGDEVDDLERNLIIGYYIQALEAIAVGNDSFFKSGIGKRHEQAPCKLENHFQPIITFSGGVGELIYALLENKIKPSKTFYGDFGFDLTLAIINSKILSSDLRKHKTESQGRATVYGLALNSTVVSGSSTYLANPTLLPLNDLPIIAQLPMNAPLSEWRQALTINQNKNVCLQVMLPHQNLPCLKEIRNFASMLSGIITQLQLTQTLVLLVEGNFGKTLGNYITQWGKLGIQLVVIDEIETRDAYFVNISQLKLGIVPVSFYGMY